MNAALWYRETWPLSRQGTLFWLFKTGTNRRVWPCLYVKRQSFLLASHTQLWMQLRGIQISSLKPDNSGQIRPNVPSSFLQASSPPILQDVHLSLLLLVEGEPLGSQPRADRLLAAGLKQHPCVTRTVCFIIKYHLSLHLNLFLTSVLSGLNKALKTNSQLSQLTGLDVYIYYL